MADLSQAYAALQKADAAGNTADAKQLSDYIRSSGTEKPADPAPAPDLTSSGIPGSIPQPTPKPTSMYDKAVGVAEAGIGALSGAATGLVAAPYGVARDIYERTVGHGKAGVSEADKYAGQVMEHAPGQPKTATGKEYLGNVADVMGNIPAIIPGVNELPMAARGIAHGADRVAGKGSELLGKARTMGDTPGMSGVGAAETDIARLRRKRADSLPVPIKLTKGQASRTFEQQQFEKETAKLPEGKALRENAALHTEQLMQNFDVFLDQTGAELSVPRAVGEKVVGAVQNKMATAKKTINAAYDAAEKSGETAERVSYKTLADHLANLDPTEKEQLAPVTKMVESQLAKNDPDKSGNISLKSLQDIRQAINKASQPGSPNMAYGIELKKLVDSAMEGGTGTLYKKANKLYRDYSKEFKNQSVIAKLTRTKPGTSDRAVAYEDIFSHSILKGSLDDVKAVRRTLQTSGEDGNQAWKELQGAAIRHIKDEATKGVTTDIHGNKVISPAALNKIVQNLEEDGKLDFIFGKAGAEKVRDVNEIAKDIYTSPPGSVNSSNTATALVALLDMAGGTMTAGFPIPVATAIKYTMGKLKSNKLKKKIADAIGSAK